jgi:type I restriction enzyme S subunit
MSSKIDWTLRKVSDLAEIETGGTPSTAVSEYWNGENFWATPTDITASNGKYISGTTRMVSNSGLKHVSKVLPVGSILLCTRATIGDARINTVPITTNQGFKNLVPRSNVCNEWLYYVLQTKIEDMKSLSSGSTFLELGTKQLGNIEISTPTYDEQKAIAKALSDIDELIETLKIELNKKMDMLSSINQRIFAGNGLPGSKFEFQNFGEICFIVTGKKDVNEGSPHGEYPFFTCSVKNTWSDSYSFDTEAILIAGNGDVGNLHYYNGKFEAYQRTYVCADFNINPRYIWFYLNYGLAENLGLNKVGSTIPYILKSQLTDFKIPVPSNRTFIDTIVKMLEDFTSDIQFLKAELAKYECIKQGMAHDLLHGKVRLV